MFLVYKSNRAILAIALCGVALLSLTACGSSSADNSAKCEAKIQSYINDFIVNGSNAAEPTTYKPCAAMKPADFDALKNKVVAANYDKMISSAFIHAFAS